MLRAEYIQKRDIKPYRGELRKVSWEGDTSCVPKGRIRKEGLSESTVRKGVEVKDGLVGSCPLQVTGVCEERDTGEGTVHWESAWA